jgi:hypothetical protein
MGNLSNSRERSLCSCCTRFSARSTVAKDGYRPTTLSVKTAYRVSHRAAMNKRSGCTLGPTHLLLPVRRPFCCIVLWFVAYREHNIIVSPIFFCNLHPTYSFLSLLMSITMIVEWYFYLSTTCLNHPFH